MKKMSKICFMGLLAAAALMAAAFFGKESSVYATKLEDITSDSIAAKKEEVADAKKEQSSIKNSISNIQNIMAGLKAQKKDLDKYISGLDSTMSGLQSNISNYEALIKEKENEIIRKEKELEEAAGREEAQYETMKSRIQYMYECGSGTYFETLLQADSFADLLNRAEYVEELTAYDNRILEAYALQKEYLALCKESLELEKITLDESKAALEEEKKGLAAIRQQKAEDLAAFEDDISITQAQLKELEADLKYQTNLIASLEKEITDEQKKILAENNMQLGYNSDGFAWPAPNCKVVTSEFGWRSDPFTGLKAYHNGVDLSGSKVEGTPIVAAYDGIVGQASYNSSMGNYIYLEHGDGLRTIYLHASKLYVSVNDVVKKGDVIAAVGSTGRSTGAHLHFSVRLNGEYVSPWNYMSR